MGAGTPLKKVFSTYVEVILPNSLAICVILCILHVCGGDPAKPFTPPAAERYSPRMWR